MLLHKYKPKTLSEIKGQDDSLEFLKNFILNFKKEKKNAILLLGPTGTGKTSSVYALANELDLEILEVNAADYRNKENIQKILGSSSKQASLFNKEKIILVDEVDGLNIKDRGGLQALLKIIDESNFPIILTANDVWGSKFNTLRKKSLLIDFKKLSYLDILKILRYICEKEKVKYEEDVLKELARRSDGDARAAINDLNILIKNGNLLNINILSERFRREELIKSLRLIFKTKNAEISLNAIDSLDENLDEVFLWLDENIPKEYTEKEDLEKAFNVLSKTDVFNGRIRRWQYWRFLVYQKILMSAGISLSKKEKYNHIVDYKRAQRILKIWISNRKYAIRNSIAEKIASKTHTSIKNVVKTIDYYKYLLDEGVIKELELDEEEVNWMDRQNKIQNLINFT